MPTEKKVLQIQKAKFLHSIGEVEIGARLWNRVKFGLNHRCCANVFIVLIKPQIFIQSQIVTLEYVYANRELDIRSLILYDYVLHYLIEILILTDPKFYATCYSKE